MLSRYECLPPKIRNKSSAHQLTGHNGVYRQEVYFVCGNDLLAEMTCWSQFLKSYDESSYTWHDCGKRLVPLCEALNLRTLGKQGHL